MKARKKAAKPEELHVPLTIEPFGLEELGLVELSGGSNGSPHPIEDFGARDQLGEPLAAPAPEAFPRPKAKLRQQRNRPRFSTLMEAKPSLMNDKDIGGIVSKGEEQTTEMRRKYKGMNFQDLRTSSPEQRFLHGRERVARRFGARRRQLGFNADCALEPKTEKERNALAPDHSKTQCHVRS